MRVGILGGGFNPPHYGHLLIAQQALDFLKLDEVWLMPCFAHPFNKELLPAEMRMKMLRFLESDKIKTSDFEIKQNKVNYTYDTLTSLSKEFPSDEFYWIMGEDQLKVFTKWKNWQELIKIYKFVVFPRHSNMDEFNKIIVNLIKENKSFKSLIPFVFDNVAISNLSSSMVRNRIKSGRTIKYLVPEEVEKFIQKNKLYL